mmetsp:Transcript_20112/g.31070  ORF Transcript_20112/g.31070 Transcript_20112/m.31070 type:complete len:156 (-) Transcript_20112:191-658(-)
MADSNDEHKQNVGTAHSSVMTITPDDTTTHTAVRRIVRSDPAACAMQNLLGSIVRCTLDDGRIATGTFVCVDRLKNIILSNVVEQRRVDSNIYSLDTNTTGTTTSTTITSSSSKNNKTIIATRQLSQAMVPGKHLVKVEVDETTYSHKVAPLVTI